MPKIHPADREAETRLSLCNAAAVKKPNRISDLVLIALSALLLLGFGIFLFLLPQKEFSAEENRTLQTFPTLSGESLLSGEFAEKVGSFYADQFPLRNFFVGVRSTSEAALLRLESNGVLIGKNGYLIDRLAYTDKNYDSAKTNLSAVSAFEEKLSASGIDVTFAVAPRTVDVVARYLPDCYDPARSEKVWEIIRESNTGAIDLSSVLREKCDAGEAVMYRTDHHWTSLGAFYAYQSLAPVLGYTPYERADFRETVVSESFLGTTYSSAGIKWVAPDSITFFRYDGDTSFTVETEGGSTETGFYRESFLSEKDQYCAFLGGNFARVSIYETLNGEKTDRPTLLLVKDSFALSLVPFLARHYNLELVDLRYYGDSLYRNLTSEDGDFRNVDRVLILVGADTMAQGEVLRKLLYGALS